MRKKSIPRVTPSALVSPELVSALIDTTSGLIVVLDREGRIVLFNRACEHLTGYRFEEVEGTYVWDRLLVPKEIDAVKDIFEDLRAGKFPNEHENFLLTKDGRRRWIHWSNTALLAKDGSVRYVIGTGVDLSARRQAEQERDELAERSKAILDTAIDGIVTIDERGIIESFNRAAERIFGYAAAEVIGKNVSVLMPPPEHAQHEDYLRRYLQTGERRVIGIGREVSGRRKDGTVFPLDLAVGEIRVRGRRLFTGILREITQRKRAQSALTESERKFRSLIETAGSAIVVLAPDHRVLEWNDEAERIYGYKRDEILGKDYFEHFLPPEVRDAVAADIEEVLRGKKTIGFENPILSRNGRRHDMVWNVSRVVDAEGRPTGIMAIGQDITERKRLEQEAQRRLQELAHVSRAQSISEVASGLAHEINQPLTAIVSYAEACRLILGRDEVDAELLRRSLADIVKQGERASEIINRLREFVRRDRIEREPVDLNALVRGALELLRHELAVHGVQVQLALEERLLSVRASRVQIEQVLFNLVRNAIDAMDASAVRELEIHTAMMRGEQPALAVAVSDTGEGLPPDALESLFDPFFSTKPGGMGLGLSISRSIVEAHGGRIWAVAREGGGTTFRFTLPFEEAGGR